MVYIQDTNVRNTTLAAFAAKFFDEFDFANPKPFFLNQPVFVPVPERFLAVAAAKSFFARRLTLLAFPVLRPSRPQVAFCRAIFAVSFVDKIGKLLEFASAFLARHCYPSRWLSRRTRKPLVPRFSLLVSSALCGTKYLCSSTGKRFFAMRAFVNDWFHTDIVLTSACPVKYFDIACKRIQAEYDRGALFAGVDAIAQPELFDAAP
jgi:hypothetical protein